MAQFTLDSKDTMNCLISLAKKLPDAIGWVGQHPKTIKIEVPDELWNRGGGNELPRKIGFQCLIRRLTEERAEAEILLGVLSRMGTKD